MANEFLGAQHISANLESYESARSGFFNFIVTDLDNIIKATYSGDPAAAQDSDKIAKAQEYLTLNVVKADVPTFSIQLLEYTRGNEKVKFAGTPSYSSGSIVVDDVIGLNTKAVLQAWQAKAYNVHTGKGGRMRDYKKDCTLIEYTQDYVPIRSWDLLGCWISGLSEESFDKSSDGKRQITATIEYDRAIPHEEEELERYDQNGKMIK